MDSPIKKEVIIGDVISDLAAGVAGEHLVCADLLLRGMNAFLTDQNCPYDVAVEHQSKLVRVQVKTTRTVKAVPQRAKYTPAYLFHTRRCGKGGRRRYTADDFDVLALVALDIRAVAYLRLDETRQTLHINRDKFLLLSDIRRVV